MTKTESLYELLSVHFLDELDAFNYAIFRNEIVLQDNLDKQGEYIAKWNFSKPVPESLAKFIR